jgi:hypothetical protein
LAAFQKWLREPEMANPFRKLNEIGIATFREYIRAGAEGAAPVELLTSVETSAPLSHKIHPGTGDFPDRQMFGIYLNTLLKDFDPQTISGDAGLWDALALHWFDRLAPLHADGTRTLRKEYHYLLSSDYRHYYRHLVRSPWQLVRVHGDAARFVLMAPRESSHPLSVHGEILEQMGGRQQVLGSRSIMAAANRLYLDPKKGRPRTGVAGNSRGSARRFGLVLRQLDLTFDPAAMKDDAFSAILPGEFDRFKPNTH